MTKASDLRIAKEDTGNIYQACSAEEGPKPAGEEEPPPASTLFHGHLNIVIDLAPDLMIRRSFYTQIPVRNRGPPLLKLRFSKSGERLGQE